MKRRILIGAAMVPGMLLLFMGAIAFWLVATTSGARFVVDKALGIHDKAAPGSIEIAEVEGRLWDSLVLRGIVARNRQGHPLLEADSLALLWRPRALLNRELEIRELRLGSVRLHETEQGFAAASDLAPESESPKPSSGMDLPLRITVAAQLERLEIERHDKEPLPPVTRIFLLAHGEGSRLSIERFAASFAGGQLLLARTELDTQARSASGFVRAARWTEALSPFVDQDLPAGIDVEGEFSWEDSEVLATLTVRDGFAELATAEIAGLIEPRLELKAAFAAEIDTLSYWFGIGPAWGMLNGQARLTGTLPEDWALQATLRCPDCGVSELGQLSLCLSGKANAAGRLEADARLLALLSPTGAHGLAVGSCRGRQEDLTCSVSADLRDALLGTVNVRGLQLAADAHLAESMTIDLKSARVAIDKDVYRLLQPARIVVAQEEVEVSGLAIALFGGRIEASGRVGFDLSGDLRISASRLNLAHLTRFVPRSALTGEIRSLDLRLRGDLEQPRVKLSMRMRNLAWDSWGLGHGQLEGSWSRNTLDGSLALRGRAATSLSTKVSLPLLWHPSTRSVELSRTSSFQGFLDAQGVDLALVELAREDWNISGRVDARAELEGTLAKPHGTLSAAMRGMKLEEIDPRLEGTADLSAQLAIDSHAVRGEIGAEARRLAWDGQKIGGVKARADIEPQETTVSIAWRPPAQGRGRARVAVPLTLDPSNTAQPATLNWNDGAEVSFEVDDLSLRPWMQRQPELTGANATVTTRGAGTLRGERLDFSAMVLGQLDHPRLGAAGLRVEIDANEAEQFARAWVRHNMGQSIKLEAWAGADIAALTRRELDFTQVPFSASGVLRHFDMALLSPFLPQDVHDLRGSASGRAQVEGTWSAPTFSGRLDLASGEVTVVPLLARLKDIEAAIVLDAESIVLERLFMRSGAGTAEASGRLIMSGLSPQTGNAQLELRRFPLARPGLPRSVIDTTVKTHFDASGAEARLKVDLSGSSVEVATELERAPASLPTSDSIRFIDTPPEVSSTQVSSVSQAMVKPLHLSIDIGQPIHISGRGIAMSWGGRLTMRERNGSPQVEGRITSDRGRFELLGKNFRLERGEISLPSSAVIDPYLDLVASTEVDATRVEARLRGRLSRPDISFTSDPPLTQPRILALLLTGRADTGEGGDGFDNDKVRTKAASLLVAFSNPALEQRLAPRLHVDRIKVGLGERADEPIVGVGKWLSQKLYVESVYHHNAPSDENRATARVEYHFKPRWSVETYYGDANVGGVDLFWTKKFAIDPSAD